MSFRLASSERKYDYSKKRWIDGQTNWYTITLHNQIAVNAHASINKGDRIIVLGNLLILDWDNGERAGTSIEIEAEAIGHDLAWGTGVFTRTVLVKDPKQDDAESLKHELTKTKEELTELRELLGELSEGRA
jgi:single-strand DNA-binding protein